MRRIILSAFIVVSAAIAAAPGPNPKTGGILAPAPGPSRTLTGVLGDRAFFRACGCYTWVISKNNHDSEMNIAAVEAEARALAGTRVRATGMWSTYIRDGRRIPYMIVTRLDPA
jgi:hypothetical protein